MQHKSTSRFTSNRLSVKEKVPERDLLNYTVKVMVTWYIFYGEANTLEVAVTISADLKDLSKGPFGESQEVTPLFYSGLEADLLVNFPLSNYKHSPSKVPISSALVLVC